MDPRVKPGGDERTKRKVPPFGRTFLALVWFKAELLSSLPLLIGFLTLTIGILLLLAGLVAATLLLTGLLAWLLVLLTRVLVLAGHRRLPCFRPSWRQRGELPCFPWILRFPPNCLAPGCCLKSTSVQAI